MHFQVNLLPLLYQFGWSSQAKLVSGENDGWAKLGRKGKGHCFALRIHSYFITLWILTLTTFMFTLPRSRHHRAKVNTSQIMRFSCAKILTRYIHCPHPWYSRIKVYSVVYQSNNPLWQWQTVCSSEASPPEKTADWRWTCTCRHWCPKMRIWFSVNKSIIILLCTELVYT